MLENKIDKIGYTVDEVRQIVDMGGWNSEWDLRVKYFFSGEKNSLVDQQQLYSAICNSLIGKMLSPVVKMAFEVPYEDLPLLINAPFICFEEAQNEADEETCKRIISWRLKVGK